MTINSEQIQALRAAAESCDKQEPLSLVVYHGKMCLRNKGGIVFTVLRDICFPEYSAENENYARLAELCTPDFILSLLAERDADKAQIAEQAKRIVQLEISCDRNYVEGMKTGWNYCDAGNSEGFNTCVEQREKDIRDARTTGIILDVGE
ncbi:TPA: hypothetical protein ACNV5L_003394 [Citrobacter braakii]